VDVLWIVGTGLCLVMIAVISTPLSSMVDAINCGQYDSIILTMHIYCLTLKCDSMALISHKKQYQHKLTLVVYLSFVNYHPSYRHQNPSLRKISSPNLPPGASSLHLTYFQKVLPASCHEPVQNMIITTNRNHTTSSQEYERLSVPIYLRYDI
jgi:hypothetical protein